MKKVLFSILSGVGIIISYIYPYIINDFLKRFFYFIYTGWLKRYFYKMEGEFLGKVSLIKPQFISIGKNVKIYGNVQLQAVLISDSISSQEPPLISIGENSVIQKDTQISASQKVQIGKNVVIADRVLIIDTTHGDFTPAHYTFNNGSEIPDVFMQNCRTRPYYSSGPVIIEDDVHIGMNCVIMPGVTIGHNSVISSSSVVVKDVPPYSIISPVPSKLVESFGA